MALYLMGRVGGSVFPMGGQSASYVNQVRVLIDM